MLVKVAESSFDVPKSKRKKPLKQGVSKELNEAWKIYNRAFKQYNIAGKPTEKSHPAKKARDEARGNLRKIRRMERKSTSEKNHNELMKTHKENVAKVSKTLKQISGLNKSTKISFIDTLKGRYSDENVLEGFCANAESLATPIDNPDYCTEFYRMVQEDNKYILEFSSDQNHTYPLMTMEDLKNILFKKLKLNKASDIYQLSVEHLRYAGDGTLVYILETINKLLDNVNYMASPEIKERKSR